MPTRLSRLLRRLGVTEARFRQLERAAMICAVVTAVATGLFFILWPPMSTAALWGGNYPPYAWGFFMILGGTFSVWGLVNGILQVEQTGVVILLWSIAFYLVNQTMIMLEVPITPSRAGGTGMIAILFFVFLARYFRLGADILAAQTVRLLEGR